MHCTNPLLALYVELLTSQTYPHTLRSLTGWANLIPPLTTHVQITSQLGIEAKHLGKEAMQKGSSGRVVERRTVNWGDGGSIPPTAISKIRQFRSPHICMCLAEETVKCSGPFYLVSMLGEAKEPIQGVNV